MSAPSPQNKRRIAREKAMAEGRIPTPQDHRRRTATAELTPEEAEEQRRQAALEEFEAADLTPLPGEDQEVEYDGETWYVNFAAVDSWTPRAKNKKYVDIEQPDPDGEVDENTIMADVEKNLLEFMSDDEYDRAGDFCFEKYGRYSKRWFLGLLREIRKHPLLGN